MAESNLKYTIRRLNETANMDVTEWLASKDLFGRNLKELSLLEDQLREVWNLGRNVVLEWSILNDSIQLLAVPQYFLATSEVVQQDVIRDILRSSKFVDRNTLERHAIVFGYDTINIPTRVKTSRFSNEELKELLAKFGPSYVEDRAVALFDIVGFSLLSPMEQVTQLNSLSYSLNSAHARMLAKKEDISFARSTTGDGFYVWNRDSSVQANINLYHFMHLALADNAIARSKSVENVTPVLRAAFHVGSHYEFSQSEGLHPISSSFIVGQVTIELARMIDRTKAGQVLVGDFKAPMRNRVTKELEYVDTVRFIERTQETLSSLEGLVLSGERIDAIRCYLTGDRIGEEFTIRRYTITDKHGMSRDAFNAKINIYRENSDPIFLGLQSENT